jgi:hypothetical protein
MTLDEVAMLSGEEMIGRYGRQAAQQLVDLIVEAVRRGEDDEAKAIDFRLREVETLLHR